MQRRVLSERRERGESVRFERERRAPSKPSLLPTRRLEQHAEQPMARNDSACEGRVRAERAERLRRRLLALSRLFVAQRRQERSQSAFTQQRRRVLRHSAQVRVRPLRRETRGAIGVPCERREHGQAGDVSDELVSGDGAIAAAPIVEDPLDVQVDPERGRGLEKLLPCDLAVPVRVELPEEVEDVGGGQVRVRHPARRRRLGRQRLERRGRRARNGRLVVHSAAQQRLDCACAYEALAALGGAAEMAQPVRGLLARHGAAALGHHHKRIQRFAARRGDGVGRGRFGGGSRFSGGSRGRRLRRISGRSCGGGGGGTLADALDLGRRCLGRGASRSLALVLQRPCHDFGAGRWLSAGVEADRVRECGGRVLLRGMQLVASEPEQKAHRARFGERLATSVVPRNRLGGLARLELHLGRASAERLGERRRSTEDGALLLHRFEPARRA